MKSTSHYCRETKIESNQLSKLLTLISNSYLNRKKTFKAAVGNRALPSLHEGLLEIALQTCGAFK